jgi:hypothetical protein
MALVKLKNAQFKKLLDSNKSTQEEREAYYKSYQSRKQAD